MHTTVNLDCLSASVCVSVGVAMNHLHDYTSFQHGGGNSGSVMCVRGCASRGQLLWKDC